MNRMQWAAVCTAVLSCACLMSGCTNISETESSAQTTVEMEVSQTETSVTASDADTETETETETKTEAALTDTASETQTSAVTTAAAGGDVVGNTGMTSAQWCKKAPAVIALRLLKRIISLYLRLRFTAAIWPISFRNRMKSFTAAVVIAEQISPIPVRKLPK